MDRHAHPPLLPASDVGFAIGDDGAVTPTVVVDVHRHPEIADLARVHAVEGIGDVRTSGRRITGPDADLFLLGIALTRPVRAAFAVAFTLPEHEGFLTTVAARGHLALATTDPAEVAAESPRWLAIDVEPDALRRALADGPPPSPPPSP